MNIYAVLCAATAAVALPMSASSQTAAPASSGITLYGRIDASANYLRYGGTATSPATSAKYVSGDSSHFGFRSNEDLGGGSRAYFKLESWFNADTGALFNPNQFWSREAYVGLGNSSIGSVQLGSQYAPGLWVSLKTDPFLRSNQGAIFTLFQQVPGNLRGFVSTVNNSVQYVSPTLSGFAARAMVSAPEGAVPGRSIHGSVEYAKDRLFAGIAYDQTKVTGAAAATPALASVDNTTVSLGATYRFDIAKLHAYYLHSDLESQPKVDGYMVGTTIPLALGEIRASWSRRNARDGSNSDVTLLAAGYFHFLSKRSTVYAVASRLNNNGTARVNLWPASVDAGTAFPRPGENVTGFQIGFRHVF